ncbi:hypothetical protein [Leekyejoonella antrihumi]|uniref:Uncharacterized protein n=1 Tax=Leekyejoonella antrihumi TaxID=1660198 RepID=A0A563E3U0_9MICO|nr:hypothetical protein [Leekyejoonella antrihumi]TWP36871.1 hypothetical protein FGL98_08970 [Leekyejoonella antrihumi]
MPDDSAATEHALNVVEAQPERAVVVDRVNVQVRLAGGADSAQPISIDPGVIHGMSDRSR